MSDERIRKFKLVTLTYSIVEDSGVVLEQNDMPISYLHGGFSDLFEKIERALEGKMAGDDVEVTLAPDEGFGPHDPELTFSDDIDNVPPQFRRVGAEVEMQNEAGDSRVFVVTQVDDRQVTVDCNHPFAGKTVHFKIQIMSVRDATPDELRQAGAQAH